MSVILLHKEYFIPDQRKKNTQDAYKNHEKTTKNFYFS